MPDAPAKRRVRPTSRLYTQAEADRMLEDRLREVQESELLSTLRMGLGQLREDILKHITNGGGHLRAGEGDVVSAMVARARLGEGVIIKVTWRKTVAALTAVVVIVVGVTTIAVNLIKLRGGP